MKDSFIVVGLGELIWDLLPQGKQLGGAPTNFAYIARLFGEEAVSASRVGADAFGREAIERLNGAGISTRFVQWDDFHPTGTVAVTVDDEGEANFCVNQNSAWDYLEWTDDWAKLSARCDAVCFGTLGQRHAQARSTILRFLKEMRADSLRVFDVNLRHSFFNKEMLYSSLELANVLKLNSDELPRLASMLDLEYTDARETALRLIEGFDLRLVAVTRGARGSLVVSRDKVCEHNGYKVRVVDTIGAGDAFAAALVHKLLRNASIEEASDAANRTGAWVASHAGATPPKGDLTPETEEKQLD